MMKDFKIENLFLNFTALLFSFSIVYTISDAINVEMILPRQVILFVLIFELVYIFIKKPLIIIGTSVFALMLIIILIKYDRDLFVQIINYSTQLFSNIIENLSQSSPIEPQFKFPYFILISVLFSTISILSICIYKRYILIYSFFTVFLIIYWYSFIDVAFVSLKMLLISLILTITIINYDKITKIYSKDDILIKIRFSFFIKPAIIISIISLILSSILPKWNNPVDWIWFESKIIERYPAVLDFRSNPAYVRGNVKANPFNFRTTGFNPNNSALGGRVIPNSRIVMNVKSDSPVYLRGSVKHTFSGTHWISEYTAVKTTKAGNIFYFPPIDSSLNYEFAKNITIQNINLASTTLFSPFMPFNVEINGDEYIYINEDMILEYPDGIYKNESYTVYYIPELPYDKLLELGVNRSKEDINNLNLYLTISDTTTSRTINLANEITKNATNDYEKAVLIEEYLRNNYFYTLDVDNYSPSENPDFVDYFLFDTKEGYCTYYASAMAIMLRILGIPSRYVEGYVANDEIAKGEYKVTQANAHAWVEAFIEPVGWMKFEPTPYYDTNNYVNIPENTPTPPIDDTSEYSPDMYRDRIINDPRNPNRQDIIEEGNNIVIDENETNDSIQPNISLRIIPISIIIMLLLRVLYIVLRNYYILNRQKKLNNNQKIEIYYYQILYIMGLLGFPKNNDETYLEYSRRINYKYFKLSDIEFDKITEIFIKTKFGLKEASIEETDLVDEFKNILLNRHKNYQGRIKYFIRKYLIGDVRI